MAWTSRVHSRPPPLAPLESDSLELNPGASSYLLRRLGYVTVSPNAHVCETGGRITSSLRGIVRIKVS